MPLNGDNDHTISNGFFHSWDYTPGSDVGHRKCNFLESGRYWPSNPMEMAETSMLSWSIPTSKVLHRVLSCNRKMSIDFLWCKFVPSRHGYFWLLTRIEPRDQKVWFEYDMHHWYNPQTCHFSSSSVGGEDSLQKLVFQCFSWLGLESLEDNFQNSTSSKSVL